MQRLASHVEHAPSWADCDRFSSAGLRKAFLNLGLLLGNGESMEQLDQLQLVVAEVQAARQQVSSVRAQVQELEGTIAAVESQPDGLTLHRQMGGVLIEVADKEGLVSELRETLDSLRVHLERFSEREKQLIQTYDELKQSLQGAQE